MPRLGSSQRWAAAVGRWGCRLLVLLLLLLVPGPSSASEITFELPDNAKQCFYEDITQGTKCTLEFQVLYRLCSPGAPVRCSRFRAVTCWGPPSWPCFSILWLIQESSLDS